MADAGHSNTPYQGPGNPRHYRYPNRFKRWLPPKPRPNPFEQYLPKELLVGIERHPTQGGITEVCICYLRGYCPNESLCFRIHPVNKTLFFKMWQEISGFDRFNNRSSMPVVGAVNGGVVTLPDPFGLPLINSSCTPIVKLPTMTRSEFQVQNSDSSRVGDSDHRSNCTDYRSWVHRSLSRSSTTAEDGTPESTVLSRTPTWNPETGDWGELTVQDWLDDASSRTPLSDVSIRSHSPPIHHLEKCETWLHEIQKSNRPLHRRPLYYPERCRKWLRNQCTLGYQCRFVHDDLEYDEVADEDRKQWPTTDRKQTTDYTQWSITIHDHIRVKVTPGFEIESIVTGFEIPYIFLHGIPKHVKTDEMLEFLKPYGSVYVQMLNKYPQSTQSAKVHFSKPEEAQAALSSLKQMDVFGSSISAELPVSTAGPRNAIFKDGTVVVEWVPPGKTWYAGYKDRASAEKSIEQARVLHGDIPIQAQIHTGLPAAGPVTVRFRGLPGHLGEDDLQKFGNATSIMWERAKYMDLSKVTYIIKSKLEGFGKLLSFELGQPSGNEYKVKAFACFASSSAADEACKSLHGIVPHFTGRTRIFAHHVRRIEYRISNESYARSWSEIADLQQYVRCRFRYNASIIVSIRNPVIIELRARELKDLRPIKLEFEKILSGDVVKHDGRVVWDNYFTTDLGSQYIQSLQIQYREVNIHVEPIGRKIRLFGPSCKRQLVAHLITNKVLELCAQRISFIPLHNLLIGIYKDQEMLALQRDLGLQNVELDTDNRCLKIRGDYAVYRKALGLVRQINKKHSTGQYSYERLCPVCLDKPTDSTRLRCGHLWCRTCLSSYLIAGITNSNFPLCCLGNEAQCTEKIPLSLAKHLLSGQQFQSLVEASFSAYVQTHSDEFHYCPSPDCPQVYRTAPKTLAGRAIQCPSCLLRICPACHQEAHEGFTCSDDDEWDKDFKEWAKDHDVKRCPGCRITIERLEGCNHVTCTKCQTHICWVCMETFPKGEGIYGHMRTVHGDFGLGPIV